jgi:predicted cupin superfamily sugar epimerase
MHPTAQALIGLLHLKPHPREGGFFAETYRSSQKSGNRSLATAIYYLLTPETFSALHRLPGDEIFHFYAGDPVEMVQLAPDGTGKKLLLGIDVHASMHPQVVVLGNTWQGCKLLSKGNFALLGTTMAPGFMYEDYEEGKMENLLKMYPEFSAEIRELTKSIESGTGF